MAEHDGGYKLLFSHPKMVEDLLRGFVREGWVEDLDFTTLERVNENFTSEDLRQRHGDMVWRLRSRSQGETWFCVYFFLEFQSTPDAFMAVRLLVYIALLYSDLVRAGAKPADGLPAVVPVVLYNGKRPWSAATDLASLFRSVPPGLRRYLPQLTYILVDESRLVTEKLDLAGNRVATLFRLDTATPEELPDLAADLSALLPARDENPELRRSLHRWLVRLLRRLLPGATIPEDVDFEEMPMLEETLIEWRDNARREGRMEGREEGRKEGREEGRQEGRQQGRAEGRQAGQVEGMRQILLHLLEQRFGALPPQIRRKVRSLSSAQRLAELAQRVLVAGSLADMEL